MSARACCNVATRFAKLGQLALPWNLSEAVWIRHDRFFPEKCFVLYNMSCKGILGLISPYLQILRPCGPMDKAPDFGSGDCRFESCHGRLIFVSIRITLLAPITLFATKRHCRWASLFVFWVGIGGIIIIWDVCQWTEALIDKTIRNNYLSTRVSLYGRRRLPSM